jgi:hypothetical protein
MNLILGSISICKINSPRQLDVHVQSSGNEKIPAVWWLVWFGARGMFTARWDRGLLLVGSMTSQRVNYHTD